MKAGNNRPCSPPSQGEAGHLLSTNRLSGPARHPSLGTPLVRRPLAPMQGHRPETQVAVADIDQARFSEQLGKPVSL